ncbi:hypothetical protein [Methylobacterium soli]|uniref:hypothetical protein n=1 Tax=Methylobacterium soli TaxID=553447 RepID=UPI001EE34C86|nr:hypothetical protein [Methylobacterium soli]
MARKGEQLGHHFGHCGTADERACRGGPETALHRFAKELLASRLALMLPPLNPDGKTQVGYAGSPFRFDSAILEHRLGTIIPDVIVRRGARDLMLEFRVTHAFDADKVAKITSLGTAAVEIDLSGLLRTSSRNALEDAILNQAPRRWLYNPKLCRTPAPAGPAKRRPAPSPSRSTATLERAYAAACREAHAMGTTSLASKRIEADGLSRAIGIDVVGMGCFRVSPLDWQAVVLVSVLDRALAGRPGVLLGKVALQQIRERAWLHARFSRLAGAEAAALCTAVPSFAPPAEAIAAWAMELSRQGILVPSSARNQWVVRRETLQLVREACLRRSASATGPTTPGAQRSSRGPV